MIAASTAMNRATWMTPAHACTLTAAISVGATLALAVPVVREPATQLFGFELVGRHHDPFTLMEQYAAGSVPRPYLQPITDLIGIALSRMTHPLLAYNALVLITFPLSALAAYAHARHVIGSAAGALLAALLFMMAPFHVAHAAYHVHIAQVQWLPLFFLALWRLVERPSLRRAIALAAALLLTGLSSFYFGFIAAVVAPVAALAYVWLWRDTDAARRRVRAMWVVATFAIAGGVGFLVMWVWLPEVIQNAPVFAFPREALDQHTARWWSYLLPPAGHFLFGESSLAMWRSSGIDQGMLEQQLSLGISVLVLAAIAVYGMGRSTNDTSRKSRARALTITAIVAGLCSLAPTVQLGSADVPTPSAILYEVAPMFRAYARFGVVVSLMITTLAGMGFAVLLAQRSQRTMALGVGLLILAAVEYFPPLPTSRDALPTMAHRWLAGQKTIRLFDCTTPSQGATAGVALLMAVPVSFPAGSLSDCADPEFAAKLAAFGFSHLLVRHESVVGAWFASGAPIEGVRTVRVERDASVYEVIAAKPQVYTTELSGFYPREYRGRESWRWMGPEATMTVINVAPQTMTATLALELEPYASVRRLRVTIDGQHADTIVASPGQRMVALRPLTLGPGPHTIQFAADGTSIPAIVAPGSADSRPLSVRFFHWRWQSAPAERPAP